MNYELTDSPSAVDLGVLSRGLQRFGESVIPGLPDESADLRFAVLARDGEDLLGGLRATAWWNALHVELLWVDERWQGRGIGTELMSRAERFARERGFQLAYLETVQTTAFYDRLGYETFGTLEDQPRGHRLHFMRKRLTG